MNQNKSRPKYLMSNCQSCHRSIRGTLEADPSSPASDGMRYVFYDALKNKDGKYDLHRDTCHFREKQIGV